MPGSLKVEAIGLAPALFTACFPLNSQGPQILGEVSGGVPGGAPAHITALGGGLVGANAAKIAAGFQTNIAIDQRGCIETSRPILYVTPTFWGDDVLRYCVTNMPGAAGRTSTFALCNMTSSYVLQVANTGIEKAADTCSPIVRAVKTIAT